MNAKLILKFASAIAALALSFLPAARANLVSDGNFNDYGGAPGQDGDPWSLSGNSGYDSSHTGGPDGTYWLDGAVGSESILSETLGTSAGHEYQISLMIDPAGGFVDEDTVYWNGNVVFDQINGDNSTGVDYTVNGVAGGNLVNGEWNSVVIDPLGIGGDILSLGVRNDPSYDGLTGVSVDASRAPDGGMTALLLGFGLVGLLAMRRKVARAL